MAEVAQRYGPYTCVRRLGAGGMAETFLAVQHGAAGFEQRVCIKFILPAYRQDASFRQMFLREATIAASLRHANIVGVIDVDAEAGYIVLELVDGVDLRTLLDAAPNRLLPPAIVSLIAIELCKALAYAHGRTRRGEPDGIVHRDISPSNVLISHAGEVKLTDFGVAKGMRSRGEPISATIKGKLCYMSPEQTRGQRLDGRADLFSLGIMLYELLCGTRPFDGPTDAQTLLRIEAGSHPSLVELAPEVPGGLALVVERMLRRNPEHRYPSADACIDALARFAPAITTYRELGTLARAARAPATLSPEEIRPSSASGKRRVLASNAATLPAPADLGQQAPWAYAPTRQDASPRRGALASIRAPLPGQAGAGASRRAWLALAASLVLGGSVVAGWLSRMSEQSDARGAGSESPSAGERSPSQIVAETTVNAARDPAPAGAEPTRAPDLPAATGAGSFEGVHAAGAITLASSPRAQRSEQPPGLEPAAQSRARAQRLTAGGARDAEHAAPPPHAAQPMAAEATGTLRVSTVPPSHVWINGQVVGWAPLIVQLPAASYEVGGGNDQQVKRSVRIRPGKQRQVVLRLGDGATGADGVATSKPEQSAAAFRPAQ